jgi:hypothetical protein
MVIWSNIYKDALILDELCMYIKNIVLLIRKIWYTRKHIFTLLNLWDIWKGQKNVTCKNLLCTGLFDSSRTWVLSLPNNLILPSLQKKIKKCHKKIISRKYYYWTLWYTSYLNMYRYTDEVNNFWIILIDPQIVYNI